MDTNGTRRSERSGNRVQGGVVPTVVGTLGAHGTGGPLGTFGVAQSVVLLAAFVAVRVYLLTASVRGDRQGPT